MDLRIKLKRPIKCNNVRYTHIVFSRYADKYSLAVMLEKSDNISEECQVISTNLSSGFTYTHSDAFFADVNNIDKKVFKILEKQGVIESCDYKEESGFVTYPVYFVSEDIAEKMEEETMEYEKVEIS